MTVLTIGAVTTDRLMQVDRLAMPDEEVRVTAVESYDGGSAANVAVGVSRLGVRAAYLGCVGNDSEGDHHRRILESEGVDITRIRTSRTGARTSTVMGFVEPGGARQLYFHGGASDELSPEDLTADTFDGIDRVHLCTLGPEFAERLIDLGRSSGRKMLISFDPGCLGIAGERLHRVRAIAPAVDMLFVNALEFGLLYPHVAPADVGRLSSSELPARMAIKLGQRGAYLYNRDQGVTYHPAFAVAAVDSTGAGDAFAAGCLAGAAQAYGEARLGPFANAVAALVTQQFGCRTGLPTMTRVTSFLQTQSEPTTSGARGRSTQP